MLFGNYKRSTEAQIQVDIVDIERVPENEFLGLIIDDEISWKS